MQQFFSGYLALGTGSTSTFVELTASDYVRQHFVVNYIDTSIAASSAGVMFTAASGWQTVTQMAFYDVGGNRLARWMLSHPFTLTDGENFLLSPGWTISTLIGGTGLYPPGTEIARLADGTTIVSDFVQMLNGAIANNPAAPKILPTSDPAALGALWNQGGIVVVSTGFGLSTGSPTITVQAGSSYSGPIGTIQIDPNIATSDLDIQGYVQSTSIPIDLVRQDSLCTFSVVDYEFSELGQTSINAGVTYVPDTSVATGVGMNFVVLGSTPSAVLVVGLGPPPHNWPHATPLTAFYWFGPAWGVDIGAYTFGVQFTDTVVPLTATIDRQASTIRFPAHTFAGTGTAHLQLTANAPGQATWTSDVIDFPLV